MRCAIILVSSRCTVEKAFTKPDDAGRKAAQYVGRSSVFFSDGLRPMGQRRQRLIFTHRHNHRHRYPPKLTHISATI